MRRIFFKTLQGRIAIRSYVLIRSRNGFIIHIGNIHHVFDLVTLKFKKPAEQILKHKRPEISDVGVIVHRGPTGIHLDFAARRKVKIL